MISLQAQIDLPEGEWLGSDSGGYKIELVYLYLYLVPQ